MRSLTLIASNGTNSSRKLVRVEDTMSEHSPPSFVEYLTLQCFISLVFLLHKETYLHTRTFSLYQGQNLLPGTTYQVYSSDRDMLSGAWQPDGNQTSLYLVHQQHSELILHSEIVGVPIRSRCDLPHADNNLQEDNMPNSIAWLNGRFPSTDMQPECRISVCMYKGLLGGDRWTGKMPANTFPYARKRRQRTGGWHT